jgi:hypothetical protein
MCMKISTQRRNFAYASRNQFTDQAIIVSHITNECSTLHCNSKQAQCMTIYEEHKVSCCVSVGIVWDARWERITSNAGIYQQWNGNIRKSSNLDLSETCTQQLCSFQHSARIVRDLICLVFLRLLTSTWSFQIRLDTVIELAMEQDLFPR